MVQITGGMIPKKTTSRRSVLQGCLVSVMVHFGVILSVVIGTITGSQALEEKAEEHLAPFEPVELVQLGEMKDDNVLPEITNPPPKEVKQDTIDPKRTRDPKASPDDKKPKDALKVPKKKERRNSILDEFEHDPTKPVNEALPAGHKEGVPEGTTTDISKLLRTWQSKVMQAVLRRWAVPVSLGEEKLKELAGKTRVSVRISADGYIVTFNITRRSGDPQFDASVERAVRAFTPAGGGRLPMPEDAALRGKVVQKGFTLSGWRAKVR